MNQYRCEKQYKREITFRNNYVHCGWKTESNLSAELILNVKCVSKKKQRQQRKREIVEGSEGGTGVGSEEEDRGNEYMN